MGNLFAKQSSLLMYFFLHDFLWGTRISLFQLFNSFKKSNNTFIKTHLIQYFISSDIAPTFELEFFLQRINVNMLIWKLQCCIGRKQIWEKDVSMVYFQGFWFYIREQNLLVLSQSGIG